MDSKKIGSFGENIASCYLESKGYKILDRNYSRKWISGPQKGEIDIIAEKDKTISFIEVKTLRGPRFLISPEEKVNFSKKRKLRQVAESWLMKKKIPLNSKWQIDVVAVKVDLKSKRAKIRHIQNAV